MNAKMSPDDAWWGPILEKAYCKMNVNCARVNAGTPLMSFRDLTGMPVERFEIKLMSDDDVHEAVVESQGRDWPMVSSCTTANYGLQSSHAYALLGGYTLGGTKLIKVMNPWGKETYTGPWNDHDSRWTPEFMKEVNMEIADDGIFFLPISIFRDSF